MNIILFGLGKFYKENRETLQGTSDLEIAALTDNNTALWGQKVDGTWVIPPTEIQSVQYDNILIMSLYKNEIFQQLLDLGVDEECIFTWDRFLAGQLSDSVKEFSEVPIEEGTGRNVLIVSQELGYDGGSLAVWNAAMAMKRYDMAVCIAVSGGNGKLINEIKSQGIMIVICPTLPYVFDMEKEWIGKFDVIMVNLFTMLESAYEISKFRPVLWWIHEAEFIYQPILDKYPVSVRKEQFLKVNICSVSRAARENFNQMFDDKCKNILMLGIPDEASGMAQNIQCRERIVFAVIGTIYPIKAQHIFVSAAANMANGQNAEFWIIGRPADSDYYQKIEGMCHSQPHVKLLGELTRKKLYDIFREIDVVVCTSPYESLPTVIIEAMMFGKVCITTENTGIVDYIQDGVNGYVVPVENVTALSETMERIMDNQNGLDKIKAAARETYEKYFTLEVFGMHLKRALMEAEQKWEECGVFQHYAECI